jgi:hypothetical protein
LTAPAPPSAAGGAKAALDGYEYQLGVSVLAALRLMLITKSATRITLEPANEEDLESDLEPTTPGRVQPSANVADGYKLVVQVKLRNSVPGRSPTSTRCSNTERPVGRLNTISTIPARAIY